MLPNMLAYPVAFLGALRAGMIAVNVNPLYTPRELQQQLANSGATVIVILENFAHKLEAVIADTQIRHVVVARLGDFVPLLKRWAFNFANSYIQPRRAGLAVRQFHHAAGCLRPAAERAAIGTRQPQPGDVALLQYTGGTTGVPKGAMLTHRNMIANTLQCLAWSGAGVRIESERVLTPLPLYHIFSLTANLLSFAVFGGLNVLIPDPRDLHRLIRAMRGGQHHRGCPASTRCSMRWSTRRNLPRSISARLRVAIGGGAAVQSEVARRWREITGSDLVEGYGLTEASPVVCINPFYSPKIGTVGLPVPSTEVTIRDDARDRARPRRGGRSLGTRSASHARLLAPPDETAGVLTADGWLRTGDVGTFDARGFLRLLDRKKDMINVSGFKVFPNEVEDIAMQHPGVFEAAVIGVPDPRTGQGVKLFVVRRDPALSRPI